MPVRDGVRGTGLHAVSAKNAAVIVDVVDLGVAFRPGNPVLCRIFRSFYVNTIGGARGRAQKTCHAFLQAVFVALEYVHATVPFLELSPFQRARAVWIVLDDRGLEHLAKGDAHAPGDRGNIPQDRHVTSIKARQYGGHNSAANRTVDALIGRTENSSGGPGET